MQTNQQQEMMRKTNTKSTIVFCVISSILLAISIVLYIVAIQAFKSIVPNDPSDAGQVIGAGCANAINSVIGVLLNFGITALAVIELPFLIISIVRLTKLKSQPELKAMKIVNVVLGALVCFLAISIWIYFLNVTGAN